MKHFLIKVIFIWKLVSVLQENKKTSDSVNTLFTCFAVADTKGRILSGLAILRTPLAPLPPGAKCRCFLEEAGMASQLQ